MNTVCKIFCFCLLLSFIACNPKKQSESQEKLDNRDTSDVSARYYQKAANLVQLISEPFSSEDSSKIQQAILYMDSAIANNPGEISSYLLFRGILYHKVGDIDVSLSDIRESFRRDTMNSSALLYEGLIAFESKKEGFEPCFEQCIHVNNSLLKKAETSPIERLAYDIDNAYAWFMIDSIRGIEEYKKVKAKYKSGDMSLMQIDLTQSSKKDVVNLLLHGGRPDFKGKQ